MKLSIILTIVFVFSFTTANLNVVNPDSTQQNTQLPTNGVAVDEVVVESSLYIKPKHHRPQLRRVRKSLLSSFNFLNSLVEHRRVKRRFDQYGQSQDISNIAAYLKYKNIYGFKKSAANVHAEASNGNHYDVPNSEGASYVLTFQLPSGQSENFTSTTSFANNAVHNDADSRANAMSVNKI